MSLEVLHRVVDDHLDMMPGKSSSLLAGTAAKLTDALLIDSVNLPHYDAGAATWRAFTCVSCLDAG